ncbi:MAG: hypothetical protein QOF11_2437 [Chloroflexota bacterium]|nr:hypothetical protein [Chloroflexota bacterium]
MNHLEEAAVHAEIDYYVVRARIVDGHARARAERLARGAVRVAGPSRGPGGPSPARAWLGRRLVTIGLAVAGDHPLAEAGSSTGQPC